VETIKGRPGLRVAVWPQGQSPVCGGLSLQPIGCTPALSVMQSCSLQFVVLYNWWAFTFYL